MRLSHIFKTIPTFFGILVRKAALLIMCSHHTMQACGSGAGDGILLQVSANKGLDNGIVISIGKIW